MRQLAFDERVHQHFFVRSVLAQSRAKRIDGVGAYRVKLERDSDRAKLAANALVLVE